MSPIEIYSETFNRGKKYTPPQRDPSFLGLWPDPEVTEKKKLWCIPFSWGKQGKRVYTIGPERRVYTIEPQTPKKKKGGSTRWWCILFSSLFKRRPRNMKTLLPKQTPLALILVDARACLVCRGILSMMERTKRFPTKQMG